MGSQPSKLEAHLRSPEVAAGCDAIDAAAKSAATARPAVDWQPDPFGPDPFSDDWGWMAPSPPPAPTPPITPPNTLPRQPSWGTAAVVLAAVLVALLCLAVAVAAVLARDADRKQPPPAPNDEKAGEPAARQAGPRPPEQPGPPVAVSPEPVRNFRPALERPQAAVDVANPTGRGLFAVVAGAGDDGWVVVPGKAGPTKAVDPREHFLRVPAKGTRSVDLPAELANAPRLLSVLTDTPSGEVVRQFLAGYPKDTPLGELLEPLRKVLAAVGHEDPHVTVYAPEK